VSLYIAQTAFGRGVFSDVPIRKGQIIEKCPVVPLTLAEYKAVCQTVLENYVYTWPGPRQRLDVPQDKWSSACVAFGFASLYNHSDTPNSEWTVSVPNRLLTFKALKAIVANEEIFHNYYWPDWKREEIGIK
jgi:SET domain-containing protein